MRTQPQNTIPASPSHSFSYLHEGSGSIASIPESAVAVSDETLTVASQKRSFRQNPLQSKLLENLPVNAENTKESYFAEWDVWRDARGEGENRTEAIARLKAYVGSSQPDETLDLSSLDLRSLPDHLPRSVRHLKCSHNILERLPDELPPLLENLDASMNRLTHLPNRLPAFLTGLNVSNNRLATLPEGLPKIIKILNASKNKLVRLPATLPADLERLNVCENDLVELPATLPPKLKSVMASDNKLAFLPNTLPASLLTIDVCDNALPSLPQTWPPRLQSLNINANLVPTLPDDLPETLGALYASNNRLSGLPDRWPAAIGYIDVSDNAITRLPEELTNYLDECCELNLDGNPFSEYVLERLASITQQEDYRGPRITFSMNSAGHEKSIRPLKNAVADWLVDRPASVLAGWQAFSTEPGAAEFSKFLDRLRDTVNYSNPEFRSGIVARLAQLSGDAHLRKGTFLISQGASARCEDRVSLACNDMKKLWLASDVKNGDFDHRLKDLVQLARGMFRLDALEKIAREKVKTLQFHDEIEVYLAFQVKLQDTLQLPLDTPDMRFFDVSWVTKDDLTRAVHQVKTLEKKEFCNYLSTSWAPWQSVLKRLDDPANVDPEKKNARIERQFAEGLSERLKEINLEDDADAQRIVGNQVYVELQLEVNNQITTNFLIKHHLAHLLDPTL